MAIIPPTLDFNNLRTTIAESINLHTIRKPIEYSLKNVLYRQGLLVPILRYCFSEVGRYYHPRSGVPGVKEAN